MKQRVLSFVSNKIYESNSKHEWETVSSRLSVSCFFYGLYMWYLPLNASQPLWCYSYVCLKHSSWPFTQHYYSDPNGVQSKKSSYLSLARSLGLKKVLGLTFDNFTPKSPSFVGTLGISPQGA